MDLTVMNDDDLVMVKEKLAGAIRKALISFDYKPRTPGEIYVTEAVNCPRRAFFNIRFNANPLTDTGAALVGKALHRLLPDLLKNLFPTAEFEVPVTYSLGGGWYLSGRIDMVYNNHVFEFKFSRNYPYNQASILYLQQANAYAVMRGAERWWLINIDRKTLTVNVESGEPNEKMFKALIERANRIIYAINNDKPPKGPDYEWECEHCPYKIICRGWREWLSQE